MKIKSKKVPYQIKLRQMFSKDVDVRKCILWSNLMSKWAIDHI